MEAIREHTMGAISRGFVPGRDRLFIPLRFLARPAFSPFSPLFSSTATLRCPPTLPHFRGGVTIEIGNISRPCASYIDSL